MKRVITLLLPLVLLNSASAQLTNASHSSADSPPQFTFLESQETKEKHEISVQALTLFTNNNYDALEKMAAEYRASKAEYADGSWKLGIIYSALEPACGASDNVYEARQVQFQNWIRAKPDSPTPRIAMARLLTDYAWEARGGGWADSVTPERWQTFSARLQGGFRYLAEADKLQSRCPVFWSSLQRIALGLQFDRPKYDRIFAQATRDFPTYSTYYKTRAVYLLPRWNGTEGEWETDLAKSADQIGGEAGDILYARVVWDVNHYGASKNVFNENPKIDYNRVVRGFRAIVKRFPDSMAAKTELVHLAALFGDQWTAKEFFPQLNGQIDVALWDENKSDGKKIFYTTYKWLYPAQTLTSRDP